MRVLQWSLIAVVVAVCACSRTPSTSEPDDWIPQAVSDLKALQKAWYDADLASGMRSDWMLHGPNPPATTDVITAAEDRLGVRLDDQYRDWLTRVGNGWPAFSGGITLYSLDEISRDLPSHQILVQFLQEESKTPQDLGAESYDDLLVIGGTADGVDYVTLACPNRQPCASAPVWIVDRGDYTRFDSLKDCVQRKIALMRTIVEQLETQRPK
ncbi:SMI1/KNR4 family protein [Nocardia brasiliensis]|uniref:SMI1/KNR4 family protein n=1 Tax=Nocardia brasiliensis TaxID=37326 RepID=UPI0018948D15|nr:SMI1/KNR4 family protein [Nocardia brasiliensis]MBF6130431.1 SMI1/KNR4 family protein [Nocardia brasiliensis]MBF6544834.1 SMI1/KNR4 family protein [Nocardia brasiliensis]